MTTPKVQPNPEHYDDCPVNTGDGPSWNRHGCRCDAITADDEAYYSEPANMAAMENGFY